MDNNLIQIYIKSVTDLADKLDQWKNAKDKRRTVNASMLSFAEEAGEIAGAMSKYRTRTKKGVDYYYTPPKELPDYEDIRAKFIDELGDLLWILVCSEYSLVETTNACGDIVASMSNTLQPDQNIESVMINLIYYISVYGIFINTLIEENQHLQNYSLAIKHRLDNISYWYGALMIKMFDEYNISLEDVMFHNMDKLGIRYDKNGKRTDGK